MARVLRTAFVAGFFASLAVAVGDTATAAATGPTVTINQASGQTDPATTSPILFTVVFSAPVTGFTSADLRFTGSTASGPLSADVTGSGTNYTLSVSGMTAPGKIVVSIPSGIAQDASGNGNRAATSTDATVTFDNVAPTVTINQSGFQSDPTGASLIYFSVRFSESVSGFTGSDVSVTGSTVGGSLLPFVSGSGANYTVAMSGMTGTGTVVASIRAGAARDAAGNLSTASTSTDNSVTYKSANLGVTIDQASSQADPTNASPVVFNVVFSAAVTGFEGSDISFAGSTVAGALTAAISGSGATYTVVVSGMTGRGTVVASIPAGAAKDASNKNNAASTSTDNVITFDNEAPTVTINQAATQPDPTNVSPVRFTTIFSEPVSGFTSDDVSFAGSSVGGTLSASVSGSGSVYTISVTGMTGNGGVVASLSPGAVTDAAGNSSTASTSTDHTVTFISMGPTVTINQAVSQSDPTNGSPIVFSVLFSAAASGFSGSDISFAGSTTGGTLTASVTGAASAYTVSISGMTTPGLVMASIPSGAAVDSLGNASAASTSSDNSVAYNAIGPTVTINQAATQADPANAGPIVFNAFFSAPVTGFDGSDISFAGSTVAGTLSASVTGSSANYSVSVTGMSGTGAVVVRIPAGAALDALGNGSQSSTSSDNSVMFDSVPPTVTINQASGQADPTGAAPILFTVTLNEAVTGFTANDLSFAGSTAAGTLTANISGTGANYTVAVGGMTTAGIVVVSVNAGAAVDTAGNASVASTSSDNIVNFDNVAPTATIDQAAGQPDPTSASPILFNVVFSEPVIGFAPGDVSFAGSTVGGALVAGISGSGAIYTVSVTGMSGAGTVVASIVAGAAMDNAGNASAASSSSDNSVSYSSTGPTVTINQTVGQSDPTRAGPIVFSVVFSTPVTGFDASDISFAGSTVGGTLIANVAGGGAAYTVTISGMTGTGTVVASIPAGRAVDLASNGNQASTSIDNLVAFDEVAPSVTINQAIGQADPTSATSILFSVTFSEPVTGFAAADVLLTGPASVGPPVVNVTGTGANYTVTVAGLTMVGTVVASIGAGAAIDAAGNPSAASTSSDNSVTFDNSGPTVTINQAASQLDPASASPVLFSVIFSEPVIGFGSTDVSFAGSTVGGTPVANVSGSGATYMVSVTGISGNGTVIASIPGGAVTDLAGNLNAASASTDNVVTFNSSLLSVTINQAAGPIGHSGQADPTRTSPISFTVVFSAPVTGFTGSDVDLSGSTVGGPLAATVTGSGTAYSVSVTGMTGTGTVIATVPAGAAIDGVGNPNTASTSTDNVVTFDNIAPTVTIDQAAGQADPASAAPVVFAVAFSEPVTGFSAADVSFAGSTVGGTLVTNVSGSGASYVVSVSGMTGNGTVVASVPAAAAKDPAGNNSLAATSTDNSVVFGGVATPVSVTINQAAVQPDPTSASPVIFTVVFSAPVTGFTGSDVSFAGSTLTGLVANVSGSAATYTVSVTGMTGTGTVVASIPAGAAQDAATTTSQASTSTDNTVTFDNVAPTVTINQAAGQNDPTNASPILFSVVFSEPVTGFTGGDVSFTGSTVGGPVAASVSGSGANYTVSVTGMTSAGSVVVSIPAGATTDAAANTSTASTSTDNTITYNATGPSVTINQAAGQADPTNAAPVQFTVVFSAPVTGFTNGGVSLAGTNVPGNLVVNVTGTGANYTVSVTGMTGTGNVVASIPAGAGADTIGNGSQASTSTDNTVTFDNIAPTVTINQSAGQTDPTNVSPIQFTVVFSEIVSGFTGTDVSFAGSTVGGTLVANVTGGGTTFTVSVTGMTGNGIVVATMPAGAAQDAAGNLSTISTSTDNTVTHAVIGPTVTINQAAGQPDPTNTSPIQFTVGFSAPVTGFSAADVDLVSHSTLSGLIANVAGSGATYTVTVTGMNGTGAVIPNIQANAATDAAGNPSLPSSSADNVVTFDNLAPTVTINQAASQVDPTNGSPIVFTVVFSEPVSGFATGDVVLTGSTVGGTLAGNVTGSGATYTVSVTGMTGSGTVIATIPAAAANDPAGNPNVASTSTDNTVTFSNVAPTVTINQAAAQADPTNTTPVVFAVVFSAPVTGFTGADVNLTGSTAPGTLVVSVTGSGAAYTVNVTGMTAPGTVIATIPAGAANDAVNTPSQASTSTDNTVTFDNVPPTVTINQAAGQADPTNASPILFTVVFSEPVNGFTGSDVSFAGSTVGGTLVANVAGSGANYTVSVTGMVGNGTVVASLPAGAAQDAATNLSQLSTSTDNTVTYTVTTPTVTIDQAAGQADPINASPIVFSVAFNTPVTGFTGSDVSFAGSTVGGTLVASVAGSGASYTVSVTGMTGTGTVVATIPAGAAQDAATNPSQASTSTDNTVTFDNVAPTVTVNQAAGQADPTSSSPILFAVVFSEAVSGFTGSDVSFAGSTVSGTLVANVSGSGGTYTVSITGMSGTGTVVASIPGGAATDLAGNLSATSTSTDNSVSFNGVGPTVTINQAAGQVDPTDRSPIEFTVVFSTPVTGFTESDVSFAGSTVEGALVPTVTGSGTTYTISVRGAINIGIVVASIPAGAAADGLGNPSQASTSTDNIVTFDGNPPLPTITKAAGQADPTNASPILFTVVFNEPVTGFTGSGVSFAGSTVGGTLAASVSGSSASYTVSVTGMTGTGTVVVGLPAGVARDAVGNFSLASATAPSVTFNNVAPTVTINLANGQADPTNALPIGFAVEFSVPVIGFTAADVSFAGSTAPGIQPSVVGSGRLYTVVIDRLTGSGTIVASIPAGAATDDAGNLSQASTSTDNTVVYDATGPRVTSASPSGTVSGPVDRVTITFSEAIQASTFTLSDVVSLTGPGGAITAIAVNALNTQQFEVLFPSQTSGAFSLVIGPDISDLVNNQMDQNANSINGEPVADRYTTSFTIAGAAALTSVTAASGQQGQTNFDVVVNAQFTHFVNGVTTAGFDGTGISVNSVTVTSPTSATLNIDISPIAFLGQRTVTLTTNAEVVFSSAAGTFFTVTASPAAIASITPDHGKQGETIVVNIGGFATHVANASTTVSFSSGVSINSILVTSPIALTVNITIQPTAAVGARTVVVATAGETATGTNAFTVNQGDPVVSDVSPTTGRRAETLSVVVNGLFTHFDATTTADFGSGIVVNSILPDSATRATVNISIDHDAALGSRTLVMHTGQETAQRVGALTVLDGLRRIRSITPVAGMQGTSGTIIVNGDFTHFTQGLTTLSLGPGIIVGTVTVNGPELLSAPFSITDAAVPGVRDVTAVSASEVVTLAGGFTVLPGETEVTVIDPNAGQIGTTLNVSLSGHFTTWQNGVTHVSYGPGITVNSNVVSSPTQITNNITIDATATLGPRNVVVTTNTETLTVFGGFTVTDVDTTPPAIRTVSPDYGTTGVPLNAVPTIEMSEPLNRSSVNATSIQLIDSFLGQPVPGTVTLDVTGRIITVTPNTLLAVSRTYYLYIGWNAALRDVAGNQFGGATFYYFTTGFATDTTGPTLVLINPPNGETGVPLNTGIWLKFDRPINAAARAAGLQILQGGIPVAGTFTFANALRQIYFAPAVAWDPDTTYTVALSPGLIDLAGNSLTNPGNRSFTTGTATDTIGPIVTAYSPWYLATDVGLHPIIRVTFSEPINPIPLTDGNFYLYNTNLGVYVPTTMAIAPDRLSATLTPIGNLNPFTQYYFYFATLYDVAGNFGGGPLVYFTTGGSADTTAPAVVSITPGNGATNVPVNALIQARMSEVIDSTSVTATTIQVTPSASGSIGVLGDQATLKLTLSGNLAPSTTYTINVSGARDLSGNLMTSFTASFTTAGSVAPDTTAPTVLSFAPANGSTNVPLNSPLSMTISESIDPSRVGPNSMGVYANNGTVRMAGTYAVSADRTIVTFTPTTLYPTSSFVYVYSNLDSSITDYAGNPLQYTYSTFTTAGTPPDITPPAVVAVTPGDGTLGVGPQAVVTLTFSESLNAAVDPSQAFALFAGGVRTNVSINRSVDNRMVFLSGTWPLNTVMTVVATGDNTDLAGNHLAPFSSTFTTAAAFDPTAASIVTQLPMGSGVARTTPITLYSNKPLNVSTVQNAFYVSQNGILVDGDLTVSGNGTALTFTPAASFEPSAAVQVFVTNDALDTFGNRINPYNGSFTIAPNPSGMAPIIVRTSPAPSSVNNPLNSVVEIEFSEPMDPSTVSVSTVIVRLQDVTPIAGTVSVLPDNRTIRFKPTNDLQAGVYYTVNLSSGIHDAQGTPFAGTSYYFYTGSQADHTAPSILSIAPANDMSGVGINASVRVAFSETINPLSVTADTVTLSGPAGPVPVTFLFASDNTSLRIIPQVPLPANALITLVIDPSDVAGNELPPVQSHFMTGLAADTLSPSIVSTSWIPGQIGLPTNAVLEVTFSEQMDVQSVLAQQNTFLYDNRLPAYVPGTLVASPDARRFTFTPAASLAVNRTYSVQVYNGVDLAGNPMFGFYGFFTTDFRDDTTAPVVAGVNPLDAATNVPRNTKIRVLFDEPVAADSGVHVSLLRNGNPIAVTSVLTNGNRLITLTPSGLLASNTAYTISAQVRDLRGNQQSVPFVSTFTTGNDADLVAPTVTGTSPFYGQTGVPLNAVFRVTFSEPIDPVTIDSGNFYSYNSAGQPIVPATIALAPDRRSATLTPTAPLLPDNQYWGTIFNYTDAAGNFGPSVGVYFYTSRASDTTPPGVVSVSPPNGSNVVPVNARVIVVMTEPVDQTSVPGAIHLTPAVVGSVSLGTDQVTLTFTPSSPLSPSTTYSVNVSGLRDLAANTMAAFNSAFTTAATTAPDLTGPTVISTSPVDRAAGVAVNSSITFTTSEPITRFGVGPNNNPVVALVPDYGYVQIAGTYTVDSTNTIVTFTPASPYPANSTITWYTNYGGLLTDWAGNALQYLAPQFTTGSTADVTPPTLLSITPSDGATELGPYITMTLTFSESVSPATVNDSTLALFNGATRIPVGIIRSLDNRMVFLPMTLTPNTTYTLVGTSDIKDLSGNAFAGFTSSFTTASFDATRPSIMTQRPTGSGVSPNTSITLFVDSPLNPSTVPAATFVSQNGSLVPGSVTVSSGGRVIRFTPSAPFAAGSVVEIAVTDAATDPSRNSLFSYYGQFLVGPDPATTAPTLIQASPIPGSLGNPMNAIVELEFSEPLDATTVTGANVRVLLNGGGTGITGTLSLRHGNRTIHFKPAGDLQAGSYYYVEVLSGMRDTQGTAFTGTNFYFYVGAQADNNAPAAPAIAPPQGSSGVGLNALGIIRFNEPVNPTTVNLESVTMTAGVAVPFVLSHLDNRTFYVTPEAPLPPSTAVTLAVSNVEDVAGNKAPAATRTFSTGPEPDTIRPTVIATSPVFGESNVPVNSVLQLRFSEPMDPGGIAADVDCMLYDFRFGCIPGGTASLSADGLVLTYVPPSTLDPATTYAFGASANLLDLAGNPLNGVSVNFFTSSVEDHAAPSVVAVSPPPLSGVGRNALIEVLFDEPVRATSLSQVNVLVGGSPLPVAARTLSNGNRTLTVTLSGLMAPNTVHTISVAGVQDVSGNTMATVTSTFTTGNGSDLVPLSTTIVFSPDGTTNVPVSVTPTLQFSEAVSPVRVWSAPLGAGIFLYVSATGQYVPVTFSFSADYRTVTVRPTTPLQAGTQYQLGVYYFVTDLTGNVYPSFNLITLTTQ